MKFKVCACFLATCFFSFSIFAQSDVGRVFRQIESSSHKQKLLIGPVCEKIAYLEFQENFPESDFLILQNLTYVSSKISGEIDLVVMDKKSYNILNIVEVKCRKNIARAAWQADHQLQRFKKLVHLQTENNFKKVKFFLNKKRIILTSSQFQEKTKYQKYSYSHSLAESYGFKQLTLSRPEILKLLNLMQIHRTVEKQFSKKTRSRCRTL